MMTSGRRISDHSSGGERKYDSQFKVVFDAIRALMEPSAVEPKRGRIGFQPIPGG
jgi:hypothetical protein